MSQSNGTPRTSTHLSPTPTWAPPKSPLTPHRLAKLANALGVSTPMPAVQPNVPFMSTSYNGPSSPSAIPDHFRRSPTPSSVHSSHSHAHTHNAGSYIQSTSKFLLHVIPPIHLPHETESFDTSDLSPPPPNASGYHTHFRRGIFVPMHSTLQSQLGAIAKEYALPSTTGLILYLVSSGGAHSRDSTSSGTAPTSPRDGESDEPGPRLSEDIWKHLWTRVLKVEREENQGFPSRSPTPNMFGLGIGVGSTPQLQQDGQGPLRPFISTSSVVTPQPQSTTYPFTPSPSTASSGFDLRSQHSKSAPPPSSNTLQSEPESPDTSSAYSFEAPGGSNADDRDAISIDLPGLHSQSIIPILAKVEFDIDRRRAGWYEPWLRSRKMNHARRAESRASRKNSAADSAASGEEREKKAPFDLRLVGKMRTASPISFSFSTSQGKEDEEDADIHGDTGYEQLSESLEDTGSEHGDDDMEYEDDSTARVGSTLSTKVDPLDEVFGTDAETWSDMRNSRDSDARRTITNPNVVELALSAADLAALPDQKDFGEGMGDGVEDTDEVKQLMDEMARPRLSVSIPSPPRPKHVPPPLMLQSSLPGGDLVVPAEPSPMPSSAGSTRLAYLHGSSSENTPQGEDAKPEPEEREDSSNEDGYRVRSPAESDKRGGAVFEDLDLGLDPSEDFDENDPNDRRKSQYLMRAQLDEIERTLAQFSPRQLKIDLEEDQPVNRVSASLSPYTAGRFSTSSAGMRSGEGPADSNRNSDIPQASWPAVPFSSLNETLNTPPSRAANLPPSPPRLALNGVTTAAPKAYNVRQSSSLDPSSESEMRKRELAEHEASYPALTPAQRRHITIESPIIPLSPDPFGRFSSTVSTANSSRQSATYWENNPIPSQFESVAERRPPSEAKTNSSRFSADSISGGEELAPAPAKPAGRASNLMNVKSIKNLWRKSAKTAVASQAPPPPAQTLGRNSPQNPPPRPSEEKMSLPPSHSPNPSIGRSSPQLAPPRPAQEQFSAPLPPRSTQPSPLVPPRAPLMQNMHMRGDSSFNQLVFDQESPYPTRRSPSVRGSPQPSPAPFLPPASSPPGTAVVPPPRGSSHMSPPSRSIPTPPLPQEKIPDKEKTGVRKSILKGWKSASGSMSQSQNSISTLNSEPRSSSEKSTSSASNNSQNGNTRGRRPSVLSFGSGRASVTSPEIPPSPQIPSQFIRASADQRQSMRSMMTQKSSTDSTLYSITQPSSPPRSMTSSRSRDSEETRPSFDASQFEIVSPKMGSSLSYPYHELDHQN